MSEPDTAPVDDSFARGHGRDGKYFRERRYAAYRQRRRQINPAFDYAGARPAVDAVLRQRTALKTALAEWDEAVAAIAPADQRDLEEADAARRQGRQPEPHHGRDASAVAESAEMAASFALIDAEDGERALTADLTHYAYEIREARQANISAHRQRLDAHLSAALEEIAAIEVEEDDLGQFEVEVIARLVDPTQVLDTRPAGAPSAWRPEDGSVAGVALANVLKGPQSHQHGRQLPRSPKADVGRARRWASMTPWPTGWRIDENGATPRTAAQVGEPKATARSRRTKAATAPT